MDHALLRRVAGADSIGYADPTIRAAEIAHGRSYCAIATRLNALRASSHQESSVTSRDFCYWLQGMFEVHKVTTLDEAQVTIIKNHLHLVFVHDIDTPDPTGKLQAVHDGKHGSGIKRC